jgi:hypothetical protein
VTGDLATHRLAVCEQIIERGLAMFVEVGEALLQIRTSACTGARTKPLRTTALSGR